MKVKKFLFLIVILSIISLCSCSVTIPRLIQDNQTISTKEKREFAKLVENDSVFFPENYLSCEENEIVFEGEEVPFSGVSFKFAYKMNNTDVENFKNKLKSNVNNAFFENIDLEDPKGIVVNKSDLKKYISEDNKIDFFICHREYEARWKIAIVSLENQRSLVYFWGHKLSQETFERTLKEEKEMNGDFPFIKNDGYFRVSSQ